MKWWAFSVLVFGACLATSCQKPASSGAKALAAGEEEKCEADPAWLAADAQPTVDHLDDDRPDCDFYKASWQEFLTATHVNGMRPAFLDYPTPASLFASSAGSPFAAKHSGFESVAIRVEKMPNVIPGGSAGSDNLGQGVQQAGGFNGILVDDHKNPVFYSLHVNQAFKDFVLDKKLTSQASIDAQPQLTFPKGVVEFKAAWQIVEPDMSKDGFITAQATVPTLVTKNGEVSLDTSQTRQVTLRLIALHVAFTLDNHPEFIWATFEHTADGQSGDLGPSAEHNPSATPVVVTAPQKRYLLYPSGTDPKIANIPASAADLIPGTQKFAKATAVYRIYPGSKIDDKGEDPDGAITQLNADIWKNITDPAKDSRGHYRLVGAVWLKHPNGTIKFGPGLRFDPTKDANGKPVSTDDPLSRLSGEHGLSSLAMESFTQKASKNCFSCHDTQEVTSNFTKTQLLKPNGLNVSHVLSSQIERQVVASLASGAKK